MPAVEPRPLWPEGVVPLVGSGAEEDRIELEAWCRRFAEECEASAAGSEAGWSDAESLMISSPTNAAAPSERFTAAGPLSRCLANKRLRRIATAAALIAALAIVILMAWMMSRGNSQVTAA
eukprot:TRINITY_DN43319_c0_g1_i1.p1 TRINITY_DN43319_c0_g1~~TRINITY_DN43319_c0_g1_i1.p1  ORF type:complete len:131 (-),score=24.22 TRINITY_DN43319_c0_g1_i1:62-424(-)